MALNILLELADPQDASHKPRLTVTLEGDECGEEIPQHTDTPFSAEQLSILLRALEISAAKAHQFTSREAAYLHQAHIINSIPPGSENGRAELTSEQLDGDKLHRFICDDLRQALFGTPKLREALVREQAAFAKAPDSEAFHIHLKIRDTQIQLFAYPWELLHHDEDELWYAAQGKISLSRYIRYATRKQVMSPLKRVNILALHCDPRIPKQESLNLQDAAEI
ncbi:MAG: hypothetical protein GY862_21920, partial [Gammaproteobacteria bacterium]|nr:hypothetical protein [Gammaproteobacteria bacterium]